MTLIINRQSTSEVRVRDVRLTHTTCILFNRFSIGMRQAAMDSEIDARNITQDRSQLVSSLSQLLSKETKLSKLTLLLIS